MTIASATIARRLKAGDFNVQDAFENGIQDIKQHPSLADDSLREGRVSSSIEKFAEISLFHSFFLTGKLVGPSEIAVCNDDEYIGAILGFAQELSRYAVSCAIENDVDSIALCKRVLVELNAKMLEFDFRNGTLRRKFDGLKYALKKLEDISYELSLVSSVSSPLGVEMEESINKKMRLEESSVPLIAVSEIDEIKARMDVYDKLREELIKASRDVQKLSKQSIFSIHRGNLEDGRSKLDTALNIAENILARMGNHSTLRHGAISCCLEEWAEGALFLEWTVSKKVLTKEELKVINDVEYVGGLSDFTGELGRVAIALATKRNIEGVRQIQQTSSIVLAALMQLNANGKYSKKVDAVSTNLRKVEDIVYELSLLNRGARAGREREQDDVAPFEEKGGSTEE